MSAPNESVISAEAREAASRWCSSNDDDIPDGGLAKVIQTAINASTARLQEAHNEAHGKSAQEIARLREQVAMIVAVADKHGWNGVENSKLVWCFLDDTITSLKLHLESEQNANRANVKVIAKLRQENEELKAALAIEAAEAIGDKS